jgi:hypothetical protein
MRKPLVAVFGIKQIRYKIPHITNLNLAGQMFVLSAGNDYAGILESDSRRPRQDGTDKRAQTPGSIMSYDESRIMRMRLAKLTS